MRTNEDLLGSPRLEEVDDPTRTGQPALERDRIGEAITIEPLIQLRRDLGDTFRVDRSGKVLSTSPQARERQADQDELGKDQLAARHGSPQIALHIRR